ncbi:MAG: Hsp70 family protein [Pirellulaceae bacterium]|jgi:molecular chaperone DnaK|nr:Hsp70 family protein [Pirellulaceae bacterium]
MDVIVGIDLGTTNSAIAVVRDGQPIVLRDESGQPILPSVVGLDYDGQLLVGQRARNQAILAPERTVKSIKRKMGQDVTVTMGDRQYTPQEISAIILRTLKQQAERALGHPVQKAVITVPAFFNDMQREATREAGELAGLEVVRIINEPTAASLVYEPHSERQERLLVYDLGGGTFDVSIVQIERGVIEVLSSHGDTQLGGDDFDQLLLDRVCHTFQEQQGLELRDLPRARSRLLQAVEAAKIRLSSEAVTELIEEFLAERDGAPLHLRHELARHAYEDLIRPLLDKTIRSVDAALADATLHAQDIDKIILVGGSSRTPLVQQLLEQQLAQPPHFEIDPDLCVALGAAVQGALIAGQDVGSVLVDITPHTLGIECLGPLRGMLSPHLFSPIIPRNTPLPATRSEIYHTVVDGQTAANIHVFQGEDQDARHNQPVGKFTLEGLNRKAVEGNEILVRFDLNLDGILTVAAVERATGLEQRLTIENPIQAFRAKNRAEAKAKLAAMFGPEQPLPSSAAVADLPAPTTAQDAARQAAQQLIGKARRILPSVSAEDRTEIERLLTHLDDTRVPLSVEEIQGLCSQLEDLLFYLEDA